jgi:hypothetical protein
MSSVPRSHNTSSDHLNKNNIIQNLASAYPHAVRDEVARYLDGFKDLPKFSQDVAKKVLARLPAVVESNTSQVSIAANDDRFALAA